MPNCAACRGAGAASVCSACKTVAYCDTDCQRANWATHKAACKAARTQPPADTQKDRACDGCGAHLSYVALNSTALKCVCGTVAWCAVACKGRNAAKHAPACSRKAEALFVHTLALATEGDNRAMSNVGFAFMTGTGTETDFGQAFHWTSRAAAGGNLNAAQPRAPAQRRTRHARRQGRGAALPAAGDRGG